MVPSTQQALNPCSPLLLFEIIIIITYHIVGERWKESVHLSPHRIWVSGGRVGVGRALGVPGRRVSAFPVIFVASCPAAPSVLPPTSPA